MTINNGKVSHLMRSLIEPLPDDDPLPDDNPLPMILMVDPLALPAGGPASNMYIRIRSESPDSRSPSLNHVMFG